MKNMKKQNKICYCLGGISPPKGPEKTLVVCLWCESVKVCRSGHSRSHMIYASHVPMLSRLIFSLPMRKA